MVKQLVGNIVTIIAVCCMICVDLQSLRDLCGSFLYATRSIFCNRVAILEISCRTICIVMRNVKSSWRSWWKCPQDIVDMLCQINIVATVDNRRAARAASNKTEPPGEADRWVGLCVKNGPPPDNIIISTLLQIAILICIVIVFSLAFASSKL